MKSSGKHPMDGEVHVDDFVVAGQETGQIKKDFKITQIPGAKEMNFQALHNLVHELKSWIRTTFSGVSKQNIDRYLDEYSYRLNRSQSKNTIFDNLIKRMVLAEKPTLLF